MQEFEGDNDRASIRDKEVLTSLGTLIQLTDVAELGASLTTLESTTRGKEPSSPHSPFPPPPPPFLFTTTAPLSSLLTISPLLPPLSPPPPPSHLAVYSRKNSFSAGETVVKCYSPGKASDVRDALAKALYSRMFYWIVMKINQCLQPEPSDDHLHIGKHTPWLRCCVCVCGGGGGMCV